ncbi:MAG: hypothetical protein Q9160_005318 [Pyrenula sp. 1 TL-2023]
MADLLDKDIDSPSYEIHALVVGASWAGIWTLYQLAEKGLHVLMIEARSDIGGVWHYTKYPGCRVDTEVPLYEFSLPRLWKQWNWSQRFPCREEIGRYLSWVCDTLNLRKHIMLNNTVTAARWDDAAHRWTIHTADGRFGTAQFFIPCGGYSTIRHIPAFEGKEDFQNSFHTSTWPENLDIREKKLGVIGTGASGIQVIEATASRVTHLTVFQRTPNLATPLCQTDFTPKTRAQYKQQYPNRFALRNSRNGVDDHGPRRNTFEDDSFGRESFYRSLWSRGGSAFWFSNYEDLLTSKSANNEAYQFWRRQVVPRIKDANVAEKLAPEIPPHAFGTKRPSLETDYFEVYNRPNVTLVDLNTDPITRITPSGIQTASDFHELDALIYATGFDFITGTMLAMGIRGVDDCPLPKKWDVTVTGNGVSTYLGLMTAGFPNMLYPIGPQAPTALGLTPQMAEVQGNWIADLLVFMRAKGFSKVEPTEDAEKAWKQEVNDAAENSLLGQTESWYNGVNIPGRKKQPLCYFGGVDRYIARLEEEKEMGYPNFRLTTGRNGG